MTPTLLMILDGWGNAPASDDNAISLANTPNWDALLAEHHVSELRTSGLAVGLPEGQMGNSEVGHMNIGAGRVVYQSLTRIDKAIAEHRFRETNAFVDACEQVIADDSTLHILGLLSDGGVHSHENHIEAMIHLAKAKGVKRIRLHAFTDGRDVAPQCAMASIIRFRDMQDEQLELYSITGRYYAMDRDSNWDRTERAYRAIALADATHTESLAKDVIDNAYQRGEFDEFIAPSIADDAVPMSEDDVVVFMNFRADRARQLTRAFAEDNFDAFDAPIQPKKVVTLTQYQADLPVDVAFPPQSLPNGLGETIAKAGLTQLRIAETEKYAHVTYFFNGGAENVCAAEDRILVPSPAVATYDLKPEMSAYDVADKLVTAIRSEQYTYICINFANPDMVGHTGSIPAAVQAVEAVDACLGRVMRACKETKMNMIVTADHGNVEQMIEPSTGEPKTSHTTFNVPVVWVDYDHTGLRLSQDYIGALCDLAPSVLKSIGLEQPEEMTGKSLLS